MTKVDAFNVFDSWPLLLRLKKFISFAKYQTRDLKFEVYSVIYLAFSKGFANAEEHFIYHFVCSFNFESKFTQRESTSERKDQIFLQP